MKFDLEMPMKTIDGTPMVQGKDSRPITLRNVLHMALSADPVWDQGTRTGDPRPLTQDEQMRRVKIMQRVVGDTLDISTEEASDIKNICRTGLVASLSLPVAALLDSGGTTEDGA